MTSNYMVEHKLRHKYESPGQVSYDVHLNMLCNDNNESLTYITTYKTDL